jgi:hypothetical protein
VTAPSAHEGATPSADESATFRFAELVGRYRLVVSKALLEFIERAFVETAPSERAERARQEALDEANRSELCIDADGTITSCAGDREFYRVKVDVAGDLHALDFEKAPGMPVTLVLAGPQRLVAHQPNKPPAEFLRVAKH